MLGKEGKNTKRINVPEQGKKLSFVMKNLIQKNKFNNDKH